LNSPLPTISAIIPARNEEGCIEAAVRSLAEQEEVSEIIVVNDQSTDRTGEILSELAKNYSNLKMADGGDLPAGWVGKNHAAWLGAQASEGEWLLFSDADTLHLPSSARRALADAAANKAALVSYSPEQIMNSFGEKALIPFVYCRLARKFNFADVNDPCNPTAAANGQFLMIHHETYDAVGGHRAVAGEVLEDVALARRVKRAGFRLYFAPGTEIARTRMYSSFAAMWEGWTKNLFGLLGGTSSYTAKELIIVVPWIALIFLVVGFFIHGVAREMLLAFAILDLVVRWLFNGRELRRNRYSMRLIVYYVPAFLLYGATVLASWWKHRRGRVVWKGREYPVGTSR
jgi:cellulose synthase/poly-beta-1,6-N-acetylglucosamine synthase-like glycosyltransferase